MTPNFNGIARAYRWLEYLTLGPMLERTRNRHLAQLKSRTRALILGDGDGRFTARLLAQNPTLKADAVDLSSTMLDLLRQRASDLPSQSFLSFRSKALLSFRSAAEESAVRTTTTPPRLRTHQGDARTFTPLTPPNLIVTHFFLDCLTQPEVDALIARLTPTLAPGSLWLISDFRIPNGALHWPARIYIRMLYLAFRILTGLRVTQLPDYAIPLRRAGFTPIAIHHSLGGILTTELWQR